MMGAYVELAYRRRMGENAELLNVIATGSQGSGKSVKALLQKLNDESS